MAIIAITSFSGISPRTNPRRLADSMAAVARDCHVSRGVVEPMRDPGPVVATLPGSGDPGTIYRFGTDIASDDRHWLSWNGVVHVARGQVAGDAAEWTFFTGDGIPKATWAGIDPSYPGAPSLAAARPMGLPAPSLRPVAAAVGSADDSAIGETRVYAWTWVDKVAGREIESAPSPPSNSVRVQGQGVALTGLDPVPAPGWTATRRRIYRAADGVFLFVAEIPAAQASFADNVAAGDLGEELPSADWTPPPAGLRGLVNLPNGMMAGFHGRDVWLCEPYRPHAWPAAYSVSVDAPAVALARSDNTLVVLTEGQPVLLQGSHPASMVMSKADVDQACASARGVVEIAGGVAYPSPDGLVLLGPSGSRIVTGGLFDERQWRSMFDPSSIRAARHDNQYVAFCDGPEEKGFVWDVAENRFSTHSLEASAVFQDIRRDKLFVVPAGTREVREWEGGAARNCLWRSKTFTLPAAMSFSAARVEAEGYPVRFRLWRDGVAAFDGEVASRAPFRLAAGAGRDWIMEIEGRREAFAAAIAGSVKELAGG